MLAARTTTNGLWMISALLGAGCAKLGSGADAARDSGAYVWQLEHRVRPTRPFVPQLSIATVYRPCTTAPADSGAERCAGGSVDTTTQQALTVAAAAAQASTKGVDPDAAHARALIDLIWSDAAANPLNEAISTLEMTLPLVDSPAKILTDLSAAYLERARRDETAEDLLRALDATARAASLDPHAAGPWFNQALALGRLGLDDEADSAWSRYIALDSTSAWSAEAREAMAKSSSSVPDSWRASPGNARVQGWESTLESWARAVLDGDTATAREKLAEAGRLGAADDVRGGDASLGDEVRLLRQSTNLRSLRIAATAHVAYAEGQRLYRGNYLLRADSLLERAGRQDVSPLLRQWSKVGHAAVLVNTNHLEEAARVLARLRETVDTSRYLALAGRIHWVTATTELRLGHFDAGIREARTAWRLFARTNERESVGAMEALEAEAELLRGNEIAGVPLLADALRDLRAFRSSVWRHGALYVLAGVASASGFALAADLVNREDVMVVRRIGQPLFVAEAELVRARSAWASGDETAAREAIQRATTIIDTLEPIAARRRFAAERQMTAAMGAQSGDPGRALALLDSALAYFTPTHAWAKVLPALVARAHCALARGDTSRGRADLTRAAAIYERERSELVSIPSRASFLESVRGAFDQLTLLRLNSGDARGALATLEEGRVSFVTLPQAARHRLPRVTSKVTNPIVDYALIRDTLFAWVVADTAVTLVRTGVAVGALLHAIAAARVALALATPTATVLPELSGLFESLVRPILPWLHAAPRLTIVTDPHLADVPFAALFDSTRRRYLVEDWDLRVESSLADALETGESGFRTARAVFVEEPRLSREDAAVLGALPAASDEVRTAMQYYTAATRLSGAGADSAGTIEALRQATIFHFAGHAVFDPERPERSRLALLPHGLSAATIASLSLPKLQLVVLSACETIRAPERHQGSLPGLGEAFRAAGARGVVGSLWAVDDRKTTALMTAFHAAYATSGDAAHALRVAQLALLHGDDPVLAAPAAWSAFRYMGF